ncbi:MAG: DUF6916 family protein [Allosphingosinicella sp.]|uniref:DUF6916 family protein n=1 Tax=Allosphingosinicella sp. TaxID=2823234 RepID=UPI0039555F7E
MEQLLFADFEGREGDTFALDGVGSPNELRLEEVSLLGVSHRDGGSFRLIFRGSGEAVLPQAIYSLRDGDTCHDMFLVPIGRDAAGCQYEAIFN